MRVLRRATFLVIAFAFFLSGSLRISAFSALRPLLTQRTQRDAENRRVKADYSNFSHATHVTNEKLTCESCHKFPTANWKDVRKGDAAFPDVTEYPEHQACLSCHRQQFFARERPVPQICSNCHVKATPLDTSRHPFPSLGEARDFVSEFRVLFPHDKHADADCADCHKTPQKTFQARPLTHAACFTCHNQESELAPLPPKCDSCHKRS